jgi:hypothetical protein
MTTRIYTAELAQEKKVTVKAFSVKAAAVAWARERVQDETVSAITVWENSGNGTAHASLVVAAEGKQACGARRAATFACGLTDTPFPHTA